MDKHELTVVVAAGLPEPLGIIKLLSLFEQCAVSDAYPETNASLVLHVVLANRVQLDLSEFAVRFRSLTELIDDFVLLAIDLKQREREPFKGQAALSR